VVNLARMLAASLPAACPLTELAGIMKATGLTSQRNPGKCRADTTEKWDEIHISTRINASQIKRPRRPI
jgi:hypothetical protein